MRLGSQQARQRPSICASLRRTLAADSTAYLSLSCTSMQRTSAPGTPWRRIISPGFRLRCWLPLFFLAVWVFCGCGWGHAQAAAALQAKMVAATVVALERMSCAQSAIALSRGCGSLSGLGGQRPPAASHRGRRQTTAQPRRHAPSAASRGHMHATAHVDRSPDSTDLSVAASWAAHAA